nr:hypothetical protein [uncultured Rhodopila sp.]
MKVMILAAVATLTLGAGAAFAQGTAGAQAPVYGSGWAANQRAQALAAKHVPSAQAPATIGPRSASAAPSAKAD